MRAFLLLILAGGLCWLAFSTFQVDEETVASFEPTSPGEPLSRERAPEPAPPAPAPAPAAEPAKQIPDQGALRTLASLLVQHPERVESWLADGGEGWVGEPRARLVRALSLALAGNGPAAVELAQGLNKVAGVTSAELAVLAAAVTGKGRGLTHASSGSTVLARAMGLSLSAHRAESAARAGRYREAAELWSDVLLAGTEMPWTTERPVITAWVGALTEAQAHHRLDPRGTWPSLEVTVEPGDNLTFIRKRLVAEHPELLICTGQMERINRLGRYIQPGEVLRVPTDRARVIVDLGERVLLYLLGDEVAAAWAVGIGQDGEGTPVGVFEVGEKERNPSWFPKGEAMVPFGHQDNPLGTRWIAWYSGGRKTGYGIHGTNDPEGVGGRVSRGCVRMHDGEVELLFDLLPLGAEITVRP